MEWACLAREHERGKEWSAGKGPVPWPTLAHKSATGNPPLFPGPEIVQYCCAIQGLPSEMRHFFLNLSALQAKNRPQSAYLAREAPQLGFKGFSFATPAHPVSLNNTILIPVATNRGSPDHNRRFANGSQRARRGFCLKLRISSESDLAVSRISADGAINSRNVRPSAP